MTNLNAEHSNETATMQSPRRARPPAMTQDIVKVVAKQDDPGIFYPPITAYRA